MRVLRLLLAIVGPVTWAIGQFPVVQTPSVYINWTDPKWIGGGMTLDLDSVPDFVVAYNGILEAHAGADGALIWQQSPGAHVMVAKGEPADIDNDGVPDILVAGALGYVAIYSGWTGTLLWATTVAASIIGGWEYVAWIGDVDGDSVRDFAVRDASTCCGGQVRVLSGATRATITVLSNGSNGFGLGFAGVADIDGDGHRDLLVGDGGYFIWVPPAVFVMSIWSGAVIRSHPFPGQTLGNDYAGRSLADVGDADGDGVHEYAIGDPRADLAGIQLAGAVRVYSGSSGSLLTEVGGTSPLESLGMNIAAAGDFDGDGSLDVAACSDYPVGVANGMPPYGDLTIFPALGPGIIARAHDLARIVRPVIVPTGDMNLDGRPELLTWALVPSQTGWHFSVVAWSYAGLPDGSFIVGPGCAGAGVAPLLGCGGGPPVGSGNPHFGLDVVYALPGTSAIFFAGTSTQSWQGIPLPYALDALGMPGCSVHVAPEYVVPVPTNASGRAFVPIPIPGGQGLSGASLNFQCYVPDSTSSLLPGALTAALRVVVL